MKSQVFTFTQFINESKKKQKFSYGCVMAFVKFPDEIKEIHKAIDKDDIYTEEGDRSFGLEKEPHATVLYGLHEGVTLKEVKECIKDIEESPLTIHNISIFDNDKYDVLKFDVKSTCLKKMNKALSDELPFSTDYPDYHPHMTIAYLKKGTAKKYIKEFKGTKFECEIDKFVYSLPDGDKKSFRFK